MQSKAFPQGSSEESRQKFFLAPSIYALERGVKGLIDCLSYL